MESTLVPVLLQELLLAFGLRGARGGRVREVLGEALRFGEGAPPRDFGGGELAREGEFFVALDPGELAQPPGVELGGRVEPVRVVHVGDLGFFLLCRVVSR